MFDDSTGLEGTCQRLYPAVPTIPMIMEHERLFEPGDELSWTFTRSRRPTGPVQRLRAFFSDRPETHQEHKRVTLSITDELVETCRTAKSLIKNVEEIPDLGIYIPEHKPTPTIDTTKYIVELIPHQT